MAGGSSINVLEQFELHPVLGGLGEALSFSQAPVFMAVACVLVLAFLHFGMKPAAVVPGRLQAAAEICYEFIHNLAVDTIGSEGTAFFLSFSPCFSSSLPVTISVSSRSLTPSPAISR